MKRLGPALILAVLFVMPTAVSAQDDEKTRDKGIEKIEEIVVTATRTEIPVGEIPSSITVISSKEIERKQKASVLEVLRGLPALDIVRSGGEGRTTSVFIRGAKSEHTLVLVDGVEMNDPISPGRSFDFANLTTDDIERIEIIRGPQSTLYGSDAIGGVINIITKKGKDKPGGFFSTEAGSYNTFREKAGLSGGNGFFNYSLGMSRTDTDGISAAGEKYGNTEKDGYENTSMSTRLGLTPAENLSLDLILRYIDARSDIDNAGGTGGDDPNHTYETKQFFLRTEAKVSLFDDVWEQKLGFSLTDHERKDNNDKDASHPDDLLRSSFDSRMTKFDWQHDFYLHETNTLTVGLETEKEEGKSDYYSESAWGPYTSTFDKKSARTTSYYLQDQVKLGGFFANAGVRLDEHSRFGTATTYRVGAAYLFKDAGAKIKATYGTGFKAPSLFQLFSSYGDESLEPEKSAGWDVGIEKSLWEDGLTLGATYFRNDFENLVEFDSATSKYMNIGEAVSKGVELFATVRPTKSLSVQASYTYTDTEDMATGKELLRRAKYKTGLDVNYRFLESGDLNLGIMYVGKREDNDYTTWPAKRVELAGYTLVNLAASYEITKNVQVFGRVENLLDEDYEEAKGFGTSGISAFGGVKLSF